MHPCPFSIIFSNVFNVFCHYFYLFWWLFCTQLTMFTAMIFWYFMLPKSCHLRREGDCHCAPWGCLLLQWWVICHDSRVRLQCFDNLFADWQLYMPDVCGLTLYVDSLLIFKKKFHNAMSHFYELPREVYTKQKTKHTYTSFSTAP